MSLDIVSCLCDIALVAEALSQPNEDTDMLTLYKFSAYNTQAMYGWGDEAEAAAYCEHLNRDREINVFSYGEITDADEIAKHEHNAEGVNLGDALSDIANDA